MRYFFHLHDDIVAMDEEGLELADDEAARRHAMDGARDMVCSQVKMGHLNLDHWIEIVDDRGRPVDRMAFRQAFTQMKY